METVMEYTHSDLLSTVPSILSSHLEDLTTLILSTNVEDDITDITTLMIDVDSSSSSIICENATVTGNYTEICPTSASVSEPTIYPATVLGVTAALAFIFAIIGTLGNALTLLAIPKCKKLRTSATAFVLNLALAELLFCLVILPLSGMQYMHLQYNDGLSMMNDKACVFFATTRYTIVQAELQTILAIAFTRTLAVTVPRVYTHISSKKATTIYIVAIWCYSLGIRLPIATGMLGKYNFNKVTMECDVSQSSPRARNIYNFLEILIPVPLILILYIIIFIQVRRSSSRVEKQAVMSRRPTLASVTSDASVISASNSRRATLASVKSDTSITSSNCSNMGSERKGSAGGEPSGGRKPSIRPLLRLTSRRRSSGSLLNNRRDTRVARTIFVIYVMIMVCSVPVAFEHIKAGLMGKVPNKEKFLLLHVLYWSQFCLNMFVYVVMNKQYRDAYIEFLSKYIPCLGAQKGKRFFWENHSTSTVKEGYSTGSLLRRKGSRKDSRKDSTQVTNTCNSPTLNRPNKQLSAIVETRGTSSYGQKSQIIEPNEYSGMLTEIDMGVD